jgi:carbamoyltransferase
MNILGISCFYHDAAAALVCDGEIVAAAEEERFSRRKHDARFPSGAIRYCLAQGGISTEQLDHVVFYEKPLLKFERILASALATFPHSRVSFTRAMQTWLAEKLWIRPTIRGQLQYSGPILFGDHHVSHAASAFYPSPYDEAAIVTLDGVGEWTTTTVGHGQGLDLELVEEIRFPHSLGLLYSAFTTYLGHEANEGEYKVMGMAAYGQPRFCDQVRQLIQVSGDGSFQLDMRYFAYHATLQGVTRRFYDVFGPPRAPDDSLDERTADIAASIQKVTEDTMVAIARHARERTGARNLVMAGGVALNCLGNTRVLREAGFDGVWIQPAAGDSGGALGAALHLYHMVLRGPRVGPLRHTYLGPAYDDDAIRAFLDGQGIGYERLGESELLRTTASLLAQKNVIGWYHGRMEFGPRALGNRSILADPRDRGMKDILNQKIKHREQFRPFAPSVLLDQADAYFDLACPSPYMLFTPRVRPDRRDAVPAITHVDGTARLQTVTPAENGRYDALIREYYRQTGTPILINTSFNVRGEPIVHTPEQAYNCFVHTDMDYLVLGDYLIDSAAKRQIDAYAGRARLRDEAAVFVS